MFFMQKQRTLVLIKPDGVVRNLVGKIIMRFEDAGLKIMRMKMVWVDDEFARKHYSDDLDEKYEEINPHENLKIGYKGKFKIN